MRVVDWEAEITCFGQVFIARLDCGHLQVVSEHDARELNALCLECENRAARTDVERMAAHMERIAANVRDAVRRG